MPAEWADEREGREVTNDRPTCCWTHCDNEQGRGTWTEINGETLPVCEEHWYGNLDAERRRLSAEVEKVRSLKNAYKRAWSDLEDVIDDISDDRWAGDEALQAAIEKAVAKSAEIRNRLGPGGDL